jgi:hypothetical protein
MKIVMIDVISYIYLINHIFLTLLCYESDLPVM